MDADHLDIYGNESELEKSFKDFAAKVSDTLIVRKGLPIKGITFGIEENADYDAKHIRIEKGTYIFDVQTPSEYVKNLQINLPGKHNVLNAVAALAMATIFGISIPVIAKALLTFKGIKRRFSYKIKTENLVLIDDYAHHPTEINAVVDAVREMYPTKKILGIFQPHLYSRTRDFADEFATSLARFDELILLDIYPARELPIEGVTSKWLLGKIENPRKQLIGKNDIVSKIKESQAQIVLTIGAGDIGEEINNIKQALKVAS